MDQERDLLFGILSVQLRRVDPQQLALVSADWAGEPERPLAERLVKSGLLSGADCRFIDDMLDEAIEADGGNLTKTLERFGGDAQVHDSFLGTIARTSTGAILHSTIPNLPLGAVRMPEGATGVREAWGRYSKIGEYARGGMGRVLVVHDEHLGRDIALKELLPVGGSPVNRNTPASQAAPLMARFLHEARITGQLEHPSIVPVYELGHRADGSLYYTMRLVHGKTLLEAITKAKSLEERLKLLPHFVDLCNAIAYAHSRHVIHRDIKPENVMVGEFGETVVLDWGLAKSRAAGNFMVERVRATRRMKLTAYCLRRLLPAKPSERPCTCRRSRPSVNWKRWTNAATCTRSERSCTNCCPAGRRFWAKRRRRS